MVIPVVITHEQERAIKYARKNGISDDTVLTNVINGSYTKGLAPLKYLSPMSLSKVLMGLYMVK